MLSKRVPAYQSGCHWGWGQWADRKRASAINVLSMEAHLSVYLALKEGRINTAVKRNTRKKSRKICFGRESLGRPVKSVYLPRTRPSRSEEHTSELQSP